MTADALPGTHANPAAGADGALAAAIRRHEGYLQRDSTNLELRLALTDLYLRAGRLHDAQQHVEALLLQAPLNGQVRATQAELLLGQRRFLEAEAVLLALCQGGDPPSGLLHGLGVARYHQRRWADALQAFERAAAAGLRHPQQLRLHAFSLHQSGREAEALALCRHWLAQQADPLDDPLAGYAAVLEYDNGHSDAAVALARQVLARRSDDADAATVLAMAGIEVQDADTALALADVVLAAQPASPRGWLARGLGHMQQQRYREAAAALQRAVAGAPDQVGLHVALGWALLAADQRPEAEAAFRAAVATDGRFAEAHGGLACALVFQNKRDEGARAAQVARRLDANCMGAVWARGTLMALAGQRSAAEALVAGALERPLTPDGRSALDHIRRFVRQQAAARGQPLQAVDNRADGAGPTPPDPGAPPHAQP